MNEKPKTDVVAGRNPVLELLRSPREVERVYIQAGLNKGPVGRIIALAKERGVPVKEVAPEKFQTLCGIQNHQGVAAAPAAESYAALEEVYARAGDKPLFVVLADGVEDPHNLGAIIRTAEAAGAHGVIIPKRHSAGLTPAAAKAAAGAAAHLPVVRVPNLAALIDRLKEEKGLWFYCADMDGRPWCTQDYSGSVGLVVGSEGAGVSRLVKEKCDFTAKVPMFGQIDSLNVSVAAGVLAYEIVRQRQKV